MLSPSLGKPGLRPEAPRFHSDTRVSQNCTGWDYNRVVTAAVSVSFSTCAACPPPGLQLTSWPLMLAYKRTQQVSPAGFDHMY